MLDGDLRREPRRQRAHARALVLRSQDVERQEGPPNTPLDVLVERIESRPQYPDDPALYDEWREGDLDVLYHYDSDHVQIRISIVDLSDGRDLWAVAEEGFCRDEPPPVERS